ncbi:hypothetical protein APY04_0134 [Hyphomicrobium sulfonivorans]|uniref:Uncharacterized protein n=1 Tax=Hyphomicrobium sulfonivorans TaxID=121290 RepID=A0A120CYD1_HYPSL|nr:hypothetical protein APY04_0134 [Hyphomicrobium sulfonivorans]
MLALAAKRAIESVFLLSHLGCLTSPRVARALDQPAPALEDSCLVPPEEAVPESITLISAR